MGTHGGKPFQDVEDLQVGTVFHEIEDNPAGSDSVVFPDDHPASAVDGGTPVLGGLDRFQPVQFADVLEPLVDELPGAGAGGPHLAAVFTGAAAGTVQHVLRAPGDRADAAVLVEDALSAGDASEQCATVFPLSRPSRVVHRHEHHVPFAEEVDDRSSAPRRRGADVARTLLHFAPPGGGTASVVLQ